MAGGPLTYARSCDCFSLPAECRMFVPHVVDTELEAAQAFARLSRQSDRYGSVHVRGRGHALITPRLRQDLTVEWVP